MIGNKIKEKRKNLGLTQSELAEKVGLSRNYISELENNRYVPSVRTLTRLARVLKMNLNFLKELSEIQDKKIS